MLSSVARSAARTLNASSQQVATTTSRTLSLPLILSGQRFYITTTSETAKQPYSEPSSTSTTTNKPARSRAEPTKGLKDKEKEKLAKEKAKTKEKLAKQKEKEKLKAAAEKAKAREMEKAKAAKEKARAQELKAKEKEKAKAQAATAKEKQAEKQRALNLKAKAEAAEERVVLEPASHMLQLPKTLPNNGLTIYVTEKAKSGAEIRGRTFFADTAKSWANENAATRADYDARAAANALQNQTNIKEFIMSHKPIEIYKHNRAVRQLQQLKESGYSGPKLSRMLNAKGLKLKIIEDPRVPSKRGPIAFNMFLSDRLEELGGQLEGPQKDRFKQAIADWKALSEEEKNSWKTKSDVHRKEVWEPAMMEIYGTTTPCHI